MRIGVFGGSFNPPHLAHLIIAELVREEFSLDHVLWIPSAQPPHKQATELAEAENRLEMVRLAVAGNPSFIVSELELDRDGPSYTIDTIQALAKAAPDDEHFLLLGGDSLADFHKWRDPEAISAAVPLIVYDREGGEQSVIPLPADRVLRMTAPRIEISSTDIRRRCTAGESIRYLVPGSVLQYIVDHDLYRS